MEIKPERGTVFVEVEEYKYPKGAALTLSNLRFNVRKGEIVGLMGPTGSGKTTTLMLMNGLIPNFFEGNLKGLIISNSMNTMKYRIQTMSRFVGLVMQDPETQIFGITVEKDVAFGPSNLSAEKNRIRTLVDESLKEVGLEGYNERLTGYLSGGEKQRVAIAGVLAMEPEILILDEPTSELDPIGKTEIFSMLSRLRDERKVTVIVSGHDSDEMLNYVDRIIVLDKGHVAWEGSPKDLFRNIPLTKSLGIRPPEIAEIGHRLAEAGLISHAEIPLYMMEAVGLLSGKLKNAAEKPYFLTEYPVHNTPVAIEVNNLVHTYSDNHNAINNISLKIRKGEFVALIGKNGAGKTTFSKHLIGLLRPTIGEVKINGRDIAGMPVAEISREVGYVFQNPDHQIFAPTVKEEIEYGLRSFGLSEEDRDARVNQALEFVGLDGNGHRHPFTLGKGERQKLAVATILAMEPGIIVIDEPTTGQDWNGTTQMMEMISRLNKKGHTVIIITHNMRIACEYTERIIAFSDGKVVLDGNPEEVFDDMEMVQDCNLSAPQSVVLSKALSQYGLPESCVTVNEVVKQIMLNQAEDVKC